MTKTNSLAYYGTYIFGSLAGGSLCYFLFLFVLHRNAIFGDSDWSVNHKPQVTLPFGGSVESGTLASCGIIMPILTVAICILWILRHKRPTLHNGKYTLLCVGLFLISSLINLICFMVWRNIMSIEFVN
jgi:hypothetical protein